MRKVFTEILPCGVLPVLSQHISHASALATVEIQYCLGCLRQDGPDQLMNLDSFGVLSPILPMLTGEKFFKTLTTRMIESVLLGMVHKLFMLYVFVFEFWK